MIKRIKSISNRTLALVLSLLMLLSSGIVGTLAANVELAPTGVNHTGGYVYFVKPSSWTTTNYIYFCIGHNSYTQLFTMTKVPNTENLYRYSLPKWDNATYHAVIATSSSWGSGNWGSSNLTNAAHCTTADTSGFQFKTGQYNLITCTNTSKNATITTTYKGTSASSLNINAQANVYSTTPTGTTYSANAMAGKVTVSGFYMSANNATSSRSAVSSTDSSYSASTTLAITSKATFKAEAKNGYEFEGWYSSSSSTTPLSTNSEYTYTLGTSNYTVYAKFREVVTDATVKFMNGTSIHDTQTVAIDGTPTTPTAPSKTGYNFLGWSLTDGGEVVTVEDQTITGDTTFYAVWEVKTYTITYYDEDGTTVLDKVKANYNTLIKDATAPAATKESTAQYDYAFGGWTLSNGTAIGDTKVTGDVNLYATFTPVTRSYTVTIVADNGDATVSYVNTEGNTVNVTSGMAVPYGTELTLTAKPDLFYSVGTWSATVGTVAGGKYTVKGDVTLTHNFASKTTYEVSIHQTTGLNGTVEAKADEGHDFAFDRMYNDNSWVYKAEAGATVNFTVTAPDGYYIERANMVDYSKDTTSVSFTVTNVNAKTDISVIYKALPTYKVTIKANDPDAYDTLTDSIDAVIHGTKVNLTATPNDGYRFVNWTVEEGTYSSVGFGDTLAVTSIIPQSDLTITANFAANSGVINVAKTEGGTVTNEGKHEVTYPKTVTAEATANNADGYLFTHWSVEAQCKNGTEGEKDKDYAIIVDDNKITVQILTDGTTVTVTANFANAQSIKVYTYSDGGFQSLKITESNGTETLIPFNGSQDPITFGDKTWYTPGDVTLTAGYNDEITAKMFGDNPLENGTGNLVIFNNTLGWDSVYLYTSTTTMWNPDKGGNTQDCTTKGLTAVQMQRIGSSNYYYAYVNSNIKYTLFLEYENNNYDRVYSNNAAYRGDYKSSMPMFTPNTTASSKASDANNQTNYYNNGSWAAKPTVSTTTNAVDITSALYNGDEWLGKEEIWLYFAANGTTVVATNRRQLNDYVTSALIKNTYNNGKNDKGYTDASWTAFTSAYTAALNTLGTGSSTQAQIDAAYTALETAYKGLTLTPTVTITGSHGAMPAFKQYYGTISFPDEGVTVTKHTGNIGDSDNDDQTKQKCEYLTATVNRNQIITINTTVNDSELMVLGWVVNGTEFIPATHDIDNADLFVGTYTCTSNAVIVPIYFRDDTIAKFNEGSDDIIKLYAKTDDSSTTWGNYMAAYTWTASTYKQFGRWTGQLMIPDESNPGMYYTYVEKFNPEAPTEVITGITFNNYGNNTGIYTGQRYQAYDYYEFMELADQDFDNIVFELNESDGVSNWPSQSKLDIDNSNYNFYPFTDFSGNEVDITRTKLTDEQKALDPALYIVRTGPCDPDTDGIGHGTADLSGSDFYVNAYVYDAEGNFIVACKTYELLNLADLKTKRDVDLTSYAGKPVEVDYASLTDTSGNKRYDGEWFGTKYGLTTVDISVQVAYINKDGSVRYYSDTETPNIAEGVGSAYVNGQASVEVDHGSEGHTINALVEEGIDFVGWYRAKVNSDGTITIDTSATPLFIERSATIDASADAVYVAVYKEHPEGTFTVNNYYYTYDDFKGQTISPYAPPVFGNDTTYSFRDVRINKIKDYHGNSISDGDKGFAGTYTQSYDNISVGDVLRITIKTTPTYSRDYVYAWYIQANEADGKINFEEIGTDAIQTNFEPGVAKEFTFDYTVEPGVTSLTIYSDVVHVTPQVTFTYIYNNRYNIEQKYVVKYTLSGDELNKYEPAAETIRDLAPYVGDIYKNVEWRVEDISADATNWTLRAFETDEFVVNVNVLGESEEFRGKFNDSISIYANAINESVTGQRGLWYLEKGEEDNGMFDAGVDEILGYGTYYGYVITGDANVYFVNDEKYESQIILSDAIYGYERATDENGVETVNKVYVDYLISMLLDVYTGEYIDVNENGKQDANEPTIIDIENTNAPVSLKAIEEAGYKVDYGMVQELLNTFGSNKDDILNHFYKSSYEMDDTKLETFIKSGKASTAGESFNGAMATYFYKYSAIDFKDYATNKNRVYMTFGYANDEANRSRYYNVKAYLTITNADSTDTLCMFSNQATLNIAEADNVTNG